MPSPVPFRKVRKLLESAGWTLDRINGSHHIFAYPGQRPLSIPVHSGKVNPVYERQAHQRIAQVQEDERQAREEGGDA